MDSQELDAELAKIQEGEGKTPLLNTLPQVPRRANHISSSELEPFNTKLAQKIQSLSSQIEAQTLALASLRRKAPQQSAQRFLTSFESSLQTSQTRLQADEAARLAEARATQISVDPPERREEVEETFRQGVRGLEEIKGGMAGTVAKMERARMAVEVVGEEQRKVGE
jgi:kinetochor protein Mis14/NSL1